jgi:aryl-alcohol dehydrogenase-like predicted oxidoreductase
VALAWLLARPVVTSVIIGAKSLAQLDDNLGVTKLRLTPEELARLDEVSAIRAEYPAWMLSTQGSARWPEPFEPG